MPYLLIKIFWLLIVGHLICDYKLQGAEMSKGKSYKTPKAEQFIPWWIVMAAHGLIHGGAVLLITDSLALAIAEAISHITIDQIKIAGFISFKVDQVLHVVCKLVWAFIFVTYGGSII